MSADWGEDVGPVPGPSGIELREMRSLYPRPAWALYVLAAALVLAALYGVYCFLAASPAYGQVLGDGSDGQEYFFSSGHTWPPAARGEVRKPSYWAGRPGDGADVCPEYLQADEYACPMRRTPGMDARRVWHPDDAGRAAGQVAERVRDSNRNHPGRD